MIDYFFTTSTLLAVLLCIIPGIFHIQTRNWGAILMTFWVIVTNTILFINSILWGNDLDDKAPIYCLISSPLYVGANFGLLASITCMIHTLHSYVSNPVILTVRVRKKQTTRILLITILVPMIFMGLYYIIQTNKYEIRPILGCYSPAHADWLFLLVDGIWPTIISIIGCYYAGNVLFLFTCSPLYSRDYSYSQVITVHYSHVITVHLLTARTSYSIIKKRLEIKSLLTYTESGLSTNKFYRLVLFCITFLLFSFPASVITLFSNIAMLHGTVELNLFDKNYNIVTRVNSGIAFFDYAKPLSGFFIFIFFGTGQDAIDTYKRWGRIIHLDSFIPCFRERPNEFSPTGSLRSFQNSSVSHIPKSPMVYNSHKHSLGDIKLSIPGEVVTGQNKSDNFLFRNGHRTPTEQAQFDMTSGIHFSGLDDYLLSYDSKRLSIYQTDLHLKESYETFEDTSTLVTTSFSTISDPQTIQHDIINSPHFQVIPPSPRHSISINNVNGIIHPFTDNGIK
ncbi:24959_t:CDS:2 [Dentiscutata erythropus]|uniref:24959_t:CDS:1 n=1 Tax=Dentiscutata erythropus TaxID=1348616 RepID=A0A9N9BT32_9GLOM|nr:24959_t:CDS:2 [Dentiscutata erythropus]